MADINLKATVNYETLQPYKIELTRGQKGSYGWTVTVHAIDPQMALDNLHHIETSLRLTYLTSTHTAEED